MIEKLTHSTAGELLWHNQLFDGLPSEMVSEFGADVDIFRYETGDIIFSEGETGDCLYLLCEGTVKISKVGRSGQQETLGFIHPGHFFGEMALLDGQPRSAQAAAAAENTVLGRVDLATFERILTCAPSSLHLNFLRSVVERLRSVNSTFIHELTRSERLGTVGSMANSIVHDLKAPMTVIRSCSDLIRQRWKEPGIAEYTAIINKSVDKMLHMTQELLDFARGKSSLMFNCVPASNVLAEMDGELRSLIPTNVHLVREDGSRSKVVVDCGRFARVLLNLIKNSVEAMPKGGLLFLTIMQGEGSVVFRVADTGTGIAPEMLPNIFEPFVTRGKSKGTGLGLAIAKSVVQAHGGTISVHSEMGAGTTFEITIPEAPEMPAAQ